MTEKDMEIFIEKRMNMQRTKYRSFLIFANYIHGVTDCMNWIREYFAMQMIGILRSNLDSQKKRLFNDLECILQAKSIQYGNETLTWDKIESK